MNRATLKTFNLIPPTENIKKSGARRTQQSSRAKTQFSYRKESRLDSETKKSITSETNCERNNNQRNEHLNVVFMETNDELPSKRHNTADTYFTPQMDLYEDKNLTTRQKSQTKNENYKTKENDDFPSDCNKGLQSKQVKKLKKIRRDGKSNADKMPYFNLTVEELQECTEIFLSSFQFSSLIDFTQTQNTSETMTYVNSEDFVTMSRQQIRECTLLLSSWSKRKVKNSGLIAERLLNKLINQILFGNKNAHLTSMTFYMAITAWLNCGSKSNAFAAASIFEKMIMLYEEENSAFQMNESNTVCNLLRNKTKKRKFPMPNTAICNIILESLGKYKTKESAMRCQSILHKMEKISPSNYNAILVNNTLSLNNTKTKFDNISINTIELNSMIERISLTTTKPNIRTYNAVMNAWAQARTKDSGKMSEEILCRARGLYQSTHDPYIQPNQKSYNIAIHSWAKTRCKDSAKNAERILHLMENDYQSRKNFNCKPDNISYTSVLTAWANSKSKISTKRAENILERMERLYFEEDLEKTGWQSTYHSSNRKEWPDTISYNAVLNVYAKCDDHNSGHKCEALFQKMEYLYRMGNENVKPDLVSYNSLINAIATNPGTLAAAHRAGEILERMEKEYKRGDETVKPDVVTYNSVIKAYSNSRDSSAAQMAEDILNRMISMHENDQRNVAPDTYTYNTVIHSWANSGNAFAAQKAEILLHKMAKQYANGNQCVKPSTVSYNSVLNALSKIKDPDAPLRSERILEQMIHLSHSGDKSIEPDVFSFCTVINTWSKSKELDKAHKALTLLRKMEELNISPNVYVYTAVLNACAYSYGNENQKRDAMNLAVDILTELQNRRDCYANHVTYATFFNACHNLLTDMDHRERDSIVEHVWNQCVNDGQVGFTTLAQVERAASPKLFKLLVGTYVRDYDVGIIADDLPKRMTYNVREKRQISCKKKWKRKRREH